MVRTFAYIAAAIAVTATTMWFILAPPVENSTSTAQTQPQNSAFTATFVAFVAAIRKAEGNTHALPPSSYNEETTRSLMAEHTRCMGDGIASALSAEDRDTMMSNMQTVIDFINSGVDPSRVAPDAPQRIAASNAMNIMNTKVPKSVEHHCNFIDGPARAVALELHHADGKSVELTGYECRPEAIKQFFCRYSLRETASDGEVSTTSVSRRFHHVDGKWQQMPASTANP